MLRPLSKYYESLLVMKMCSFALVFFYWNDPIIKNHIHRITLQNNDPYYNIGSTMSPSHTFQDSHSFIMKSISRAWRKVDSLVSQDISSSWMGWDLERRPIWSCNVVSARHMYYIHLAISRMTIEQENVFYWKDLWNEW